MQGTTIIPPLTSPEGIAATALDTSYRYVEPAGNWYVAEPCPDPWRPPSNTPEANQSHGSISSFSPFEGGQSLQVSGLSFTNGLQLQTLGSARRIAWAPNRPCTIEAWFYLPYNSFGDPVIWQAQIGINVRITSLTTQPQRTVISSVYFATPYNMERNYRFSARDFPGQFDPDGISVLGATVASPSVSLDNWVHCAITSTGSRFCYFTNGQLEFAAIPGESMGYPVAPDLSPMLQTYESAVPFASLIPRGASTMQGPIPDAYVRGVRYTPRVRYPEAGFTPVHY